MKKIILVILAGVLLISSCGIDPEKKKRERRKLVDSLVKLEIDSIKKDLDSLCELRKVENFDRLVDSLKIERIEDIKKKMKSLGK